MRTGTSERPTLVLRPRSGSFATSVVTTGALSVLPPSLALFALSIPTGRWPTVLAVLLVTTGVVALAAIRMRNTLIEVRETTVIDRGYWGPGARVPLAELQSILVVKLMAGGSPEIHKQLFVLDRAGRTRIRMRGQYWHPDDLRRLERVLGLPARTADAPLTASEFRSVYRRNLLWHERHPLLTAAAVATLALCVAAPVFITLNELV